MSKDQIPAILESMSLGDSLRKSCEGAGVSPNTFLHWVDADKELLVQYTHARARMLDAQAEALEDISDQAVNAESAIKVAGLKLKSDNRKWLLSKLSPKKYGDKLEIEQRTTLMDLTEEQIDARIARLSNPTSET
jgi:hypothetical protein